MCDCQDCSSEDILLHQSGNTEHQLLLCTSLTWTNDLTIGWQKINLLSHPNATIAPHSRQARASGEILNYTTLAPQARQARASGEILNYVTLAPQTRQARTSGKNLNYVT